MAKIHSWTEETLQNLKNGTIKFEDLTDGCFIYDHFALRPERIWNLLNENICSFKQIVDRVKKIDDNEYDPCLYLLLGTKELFEELIDNNLVTKDDLKYLLNKIDHWLEVTNLCKNTTLIKHILNEFVLDTEIVDKFSEILNKNIFDFIEYAENKRSTMKFKNNKLSKLNTLNRYVYRFDEEQRLELIELIQNNEIAQNRLIRIVDSNLESNYDFDSLMDYLKKAEKKNVLNI